MQLEERILIFNSLSRYLSGSDFSRLNDPLGSFTLFGFQEQNGVNLKSFDKSRRLLGG